MVQDPDKLSNLPLLLVGLMGSGKTSVGKRLARRLGLPFLDADDEIETAAGRTISEIFDEFGEEEFRALEHRVLARLIKGERAVIATGGGAFIAKKNRELIRNQAISIWLDADLDTLWERVRHKKHRPLLTNSQNPKEKLTELYHERRPFYALADHRVFSVADQPHEIMVGKICKALGGDLGSEDDMT